MKTGSLWLVQFALFLSTYGSTAKEAYNLRLLNLVESSGKTLDELLLSLWRRISDLKIWLSTLRQLNRFQNVKSICPNIYCPLRRLLNVMSKVLKQDISVDGVFFVIILMNSYFIIVILLLFAFELAVFVKV